MPININDPIEVAQWIDQNKTEIEEWLDMLDEIEKEEEDDNSKI